MKYTFSGHGSFQCRSQWLKKGYDFVNAGNKFSDDDAVATLGVGKNMVSAIQYWLRAFDILDKDDVLTEIGHNIFQDGGWDPYLEDEATLWLLHYQLVKKGFASIYQLVFNELRREKVEFTKEQFVEFIKRKMKGKKPRVISEKTLGTDFVVMTRMYLNSDVSKNKEEALEGLFPELKLIRRYKRRIDERVEDYCIIENTEKRRIPEEILLYAIADMEGYDKSIDFTALEHNSNGIGAVFAINRAGLTDILKNITKRYDSITFNDHAGRRELQFSEKRNPLDYLNMYYEK